MNRIGSLAVHVSCNDIASNGIEPLGIMLTVLLPPDTTEADIELIMQQAADAARAVNVEIIGGHTEITDAVTRPIISSTAVGRAETGEVKRSSMCPGNRIIVTKKLAMEGTGILANEYERRLRGSLSEEELNRARAMLDDISVIKEGIIAGKLGTSAMHDITEGGVLGAVWELCHLSGTGALIEEAALPLDAVTVKICNLLGVNPLRLISSGSMMIVAPAGKAEKILHALAEVGIEAACIGVVTEAEKGIRMMPKGDAAGGSASDCLGATTIEPPVSDEIYKDLWK
jgi:hydrogenase expression/formation protein HypE